MKELTDHFEGCNDILTTQFVMSLLPPAIRREVKGLLQLLLLLLLILFGHFSGAATYQFQNTSSRTIAEVKQC